MDADIGTILTHILVVLVAAKLAAEVAERIGVPAVVGEIVAGIIIGPSMLGLVGNGEEVLRTLGELGVILLLLDVGLEMDLGELRAVGRASLLDGHGRSDCAARARARRDGGDREPSSRLRCSLRRRSPRRASASRPACSAIYAPSPRPRPASSSAPPSPTTSSASSS